ncbi:MucR family transcriptional regulator [Notoacmeibacter sp. MSK16QG-6]|uniref:MucR family transcriptional regulator n=1 Tax=Notoacmeibacter sp. MSK16QG-6 TaxID=2957982 RepID=UPI00209D22F7|nr:MucR family transcriptional regulator [Notoacmeibacter sp. MSK16QG-6]MCP1198151.1 MucR family transcriptional regulator [Notoacmeibacter sp. MSK16QG-6]
MELSENKNAQDAQLIDLTAEVVTAYVGNNPVPATDLPSLISEIHNAFSRIRGTGQAVAETEKPKPAVNPKRSVSDDYIVCLEDGKKFKSLKRHLSAHYNMTPEQYREKWGLPADYPMVAPNYSAARSKLAKKTGLGRKAKS